MENNIKRVMIIGWDGADWSVLKPLLDAGRLPVLQSLMKKGVSGSLRSTIPTHSYTAWASFMTGKNPGKHGIYTFLSHATQGDGISHIDRRSIVGETFFEVLSRHGRKVGTAHVPLSFPPVPINGFWVSGMVIPLGAQYTYPLNIQTELDDAWIEEIAWAWLENEWEKLFDLADKKVEAQTRGLHYLLTRFDLDSMTYVFVSPDRLMHPGMNLIDKSHPDYDGSLSERYLSNLNGHFEMLDSVLGEVLSRAGKDTLLLLISDHGFRSCWLSFSAHSWLIERGYQKMHRDWRKVRKYIKDQLRVLGISPEKGKKIQKRGGGFLGNPIDWTKTQAYIGSVSEQGIRINLQGREKMGVVPATEYEGVRKNIQAELKQLVDPETGLYLFSEVYLREEILHGPRLEQAPDILFDFSPGFTVPTSSLGHEIISRAGWKSGDHALDGILVAYGPHTRSGKQVDNAKLVDIAPTVLHILGVPIPEDMDGVFLEDIFERVDFGKLQYEKPLENITENDNYSAKEKEHINDRLRSLGYL